MKNKDDSMNWIPLWVDKWIFGSTRIELKPDERAVWVDLMALGAKDNGFIRANPETPYTNQQLAGLLCISEELLVRALVQCTSTGKIKKCESGAGYYICNWSEYQLSERHKRRFERNLKESSNTMSEKMDPMSKSTAPIGEDRIGEERILYKYNFSSFWNSYPKKIGRGKCESIWKKLKPSQKLIQTMILKIEAIKKTDQWKKDNGQFIPLPATWLNQKRWEDETPFQQGITIKESPPPEIIPKDFVPDPHGKERLEEIIGSLSIKKSISPPHNEEERREQLEQQKKELGV